MTTPFTADHTSRLTVRIGDINYGGHLGHDRLITLLHQACIELLHALGATETDCFGAGLIMRHLTCDYRGEAFLDDTLDIAMRVDNLRNAAYTLQYSVTCQGRPIATAAVEMVAYDYQRHKIIVLPPAFADALHRCRENHHDQ